MALVDQPDKIQWKVGLGGTGKALQRVGCSIGALSSKAWLSLIIFPPSIMGTLIFFEVISNEIVQIAYPVFCLCIWLALATIGDSYRTVWYQVDESGSQLILARDGYDPEINLVSLSENPTIPLDEIQTVTVATIGEYLIIRLNYGAANFSKIDVMIIPLDDSMIWKKLQQVQPSLPSLPSVASKSGRFGDLRYVISVAIVGVLPLMLIDQRLLSTVLLITFFIITIGLLQNLIVVIRDRQPNQDNQRIVHAFFGTVKTFVIISMIISTGYILNTLF